MNFKLNNTLSNEINTLIIGIPAHLNQLERISFNHIDITESLKRLKPQRVIGSKVGKIYTTALDVQDQTYRLITVGLGNLKTRSYQDMLKIWGHLFQYIKSEHIEDTYL
ncbi:M17 family peptidase N-terminal domain-containing protein, partial [Staphylococcus aureus]|uniref:M17 family peptidase N-terminal domain-containing protein n=1 Tax=Staphylococcus aureus TaxID=1280 RepID=UPI0010DF7C6E